MSVRRIVAATAGALAVGGAGELLARVGGPEALLATAAVAGAGAGWFAALPGCEKRKEASPPAELREREEQVQERVSRSTLCDAATFDLLADKQVKICRRNEWPVGLVMIEIDRWDTLVRRHGHEAAGRVVDYVGGVIVETIRESDVAAYLGTGRLAMLLPQCDLDNARKVIQRIQANILSHPLEGESEDGAIPIPFSAGTVALSGRVARYGLLRQRAMVALEKARELGGNRIESY